MFYIYRLSHHVSFSSQMGLLGGSSEKLCWILHETPFSSLGMHVNQGQLHNFSHPHCVIICRLQHL